MKKIIYALTVCFTLYCSVANASFPVENNAKVVNVENTTTINTPTVSEEVSAPVTIKATEKSKVATEANKMDEETLITLLLWFFVGGLAAHRWYRGKPTGANILFILTLGGCGIWAIIDLINILTGKF